MRKDMSYLRKKMQQRESSHLLQRIMRCIKYVFRVKVRGLKHLSQLIRWVITGLSEVFFVIFFVGKAGTGMDREVSLVLKHGAEAKDYDKVLKKLNRADIKTVLPIGSN